MFKPYNLDQKILFPEDVSKYLGPDHEAKIIREAVRSVFEVDTSSVSKFSAGHSSEGRPAFDPEMMVTLLCYGYAIGIRSSRKIARLPKRDMGAYWLTAGQNPDFRTIALFRTKNKEALENLFANVLVLAERLGLLRLGVLTLDGTKIRANARTAMSTIEQLDERLAKHKETVATILAEVASADCDEDKQFGKKKDGNSVENEYSSPEERRSALRTIATDLRKIGERKKAKKLEATLETIERMEKAKVSAGEQISKKASITDPDSRFMKVEFGKILPGYNAQAIVEEKSKIIVGATVLQDSNDCYACAPTLDDMKNHLGENCLEGRELIADNGYFNRTNIEALVNRNVDFLIKPEGEGNRQYTKPESEKKPPRFSRSDFTFHDTGDHKTSYYLCPNEKRLEFAGREWLDSATKKTRGRERAWGWKYKYSECKTCPLADQCLESDRRNRTLVRDPIADPHKDRMREAFKRDDIKKKYTIRMYTAEPVFADIKEHRKFRMFLLRGIEKAKIEWRWSCLTHNLLRAGKQLLKSAVPLPQLT